MNSFQELNNYGSEQITFTDNSNYLLVWGPFAGNANIIANTTVAHTLENRQPISTFDNSIKPLYVIVTSPQDIEGIPIANIAYTGNNSNITVAKNNATQWSIGNIWTIADYNEAFANTTVYIEALRQNDFTYSTLVSDQQGNSKFFTTTVDVIPFGFSRPTSVVFNEDSNAQITGMAITDISNQTYDITFTLNPTSAGTMKWDYTGNTGTELETYGTRDEVNTYLTGNITFIPADDYASNANILANVYNVSTGNIVGLANIRLIIGTTHADYTVPDGGYAWSGGANTPIGTTNQGNIRITDLAQNRSYSSKLTLTPPTMGNLYVGNTNLGNTATFTGTINQVNANLANVIFVGNANANQGGNLNYLQIQTTANITQANVNLPMAYQIPAIHIYSNVAKPVGTRLDNTGGQGGNATANVDFWGYQYNLFNNNYPPGSPYSTYIYSTPITTNISLSTMRSSTVYKYAPMSIYVPPYYGLQDRRESRAAGTAGYFAFWLRLNANHRYASICQLFGANVTENSTDAMVLMSFNNQLFWSASGLTIQEDGFTKRRIAMGATPAAGVWTHLAIQISAGTTGSTGTQVVSAWRDGVPITQFYSSGGGAQPGGTLQTGATWSGKDTFNCINGWIFGAPLDVPTTTYFGFNDTLQQFPLNAYIDDIVVRSDAPYTNLQAFTPGPVTWGGNVTQMMTGI